MRNNIKVKIEAIAGNSNSSICYYQAIEVIFSTKPNNVPNESYNGSLAGKYLIWYPLSTSLVDLTQTHPNGEIQFHSLNEVFEWTSRMRSIPTHLRSKGTTPTKTISAEDIEPEGSTITVCYWQLVRYRPCGHTFPGVYRNLCYHSIDEGTE